MSLIKGRYLWMVLLAAGLPACGGSSSTTTPPIPTPTPPPPEVRTLIMEDGFSGLPERTLAPVPFSTSATGTIEATVDWTFATDNVEVYLVRGSCTVDQFNNGTCNFAAFSESTTAKPERIRATNQPADSYTLYIGNRGPDEESVSFQVFLVTGGSGASASRSQAGVARGGADFVRIVRRP